MQAIRESAAHTLRAARWDPVTPYPDGDLYTSDLNYGEWGRVNANSVSGNGSVMFLLGHENGSGRSGVTRLQGSTFGANTNLLLQFDIVDMDANTELYVEVWEAKDGASSPNLYYMDSVSGNGAGPAVKTWGSNGTDGLFFNELASAYYQDGDPEEGTTVSMNFTRTDTSADLVLFFHGEKASGTTWWAATDIDNAKILVPEPSAFALAGLGLTGLTILRLRRS